MVARRAGDSDVVFRHVGGVSAVGWSILTAVKLLSAASVSYGSSQHPAAIKRFCRCIQKQYLLKVEEEAPLGVVLKSSFPRYFLLVTKVVEPYPGVMWVDGAFGLAPGGDSGNLQNSMDSATRGICAFIKKKQSTTCSRGEKRARHLSAVARLIKGRWLTTRTGLCHLPLILGQVFRKAANHHTCA